MRVLFLTQILPYPLDAGPRIKTWNVLRYLKARGYEIVLASFVRPEEQKHVQAVLQTCDEVHAIPIRRSRLLDVGRYAQSQLLNRPFVVQRDDLQAMHSLVQQMLAQREFDYLHADQLTMAQYAIHGRGPSADRGLAEAVAAGPISGVRSKRSGDDGPTLVFDAHNAVWELLERTKSTVSPLLKPVVGLEAFRVKRYEGELVHKFDYVLTVTEHDRQAMLDACSAASNGHRQHHQTNACDAKILIIPIAVDTERLMALPRPSNSKNVLALGSLHYPPNADGVRWFAREIFPLVKDEIPDATLTIVGKAPPRDLREMADRHPDSVAVTGYVERVEPYIEAAALTVVPVRAGGGMRVRILEAFARGIPVVTTPIGLEGIDAQAGEEVLVSETPRAFASNVARLLSDQSLQAGLSARARRLVEREYDWQTVLKRLDSVYGQ
jgi:glycosyltransferase involved in cell wall biosynthesis